MKISLMQTVTCDLKAGSKKELKDDNLAIFNRVWMILQQHICKTSLGSLDRKLDVDKVLSLESLNL